MSKRYLLLTYSCESLHRDSQLILKHQARPIFLLRGVLFLKYSAYIFLFNFICFKNVCHLRGHVGGTYFSDNGQSLITRLQDQTVLQCLGGILSDVLSFDALSTGSRGLLYYDSFFFHICLHVSHMFYKIHRRELCTRGTQRLKQMIDHNYSELMFMIPRSIQIQSMTHCYCIQPTIVLF